MNNSFARLVEGMCSQLQHEVLPRVADEYARSQLWGVINALNTFHARADWSAELLQQQIEAQQRALMAVAPLWPGDVPWQVPALGTVASTAELLAARELGNRAIDDALSRLADPALAMAPELRARAEVALRAAMRAEVDLELKHAPRPLFAQMSGSASA